MKPRLAAILATICLLSGCWEKFPEFPPEPPAEVISCMEIRVADSAMDFGSFTSGAPEEAPAAETAALLERTLALYPEGFLAQLGPVEVLLVDSLTGSGTFAHGSYAGFTQRIEGGWLMVLDVTACDAGTIHHEIAHILDGILTQAGALTAEKWMGYCPPGFVYGQGDWGQYPDFFVDEYAMQNMQEDRARLFETAVQMGEGAFGGSAALWLKLSYFAGAIRSYFDTEGWPEQTVWELALD